MATFAAATVVSLRPANVREFSRTMSEAGKSGRSFRAQIGDRTIDLNVDGAGVVIDGRSHEISFEFISEHEIALLVDGRSVPAVVEPEGEGRYVVTIRGHPFEVRLKDERDLLLERFALAWGASGGLQQIRAPMPGLVLSVLVEQDQRIDAGAGLVVLEAMKMENELRAESPGTVKALHVTAGDAVAKNELLIEIEPISEEEPSPR